MIGVRPLTRRRPRQRRAGNARLVALSGAALLLLPIPYTALFLNVLRRVHYFSALLLVPLLLVKLASTGWRALGYYPAILGIARTVRPTRCRGSPPRPWWRPRSCSSAVDW